MAGSVDNSDKIKGILSDVNTIHNTRILSLKSKQTEAILLAEKGDLLCVLPTGYGKTIIIQCLPYLKHSSPGCIVVVNALNCIISEQKDRFGDRCVVIDDVLIKYLENDTPDSSFDEEIKVI